LAGEEEEKKKQGRKIAFIQIANIKAEYTLVN
jgi:hypothetical protein